MGMIGCFAAASSKTLEELKNNPDELEEYLYPNDAEDDPPNYLDIDKTWDGIHFMLSGSADGGEEPLSLAVFGGEEVGEEIGCAGPARFLTPPQVKAVSAALDALGEDGFRGRFVPQEMDEAEIYPAGIWVRENLEALEYLMEGYRKLVVFYSQAAARGDGAILWIG